MPGPPPQPRTSVGAAGLAAILADPGRTVIAMDFDGTLSAIVERPEDARPVPGALDALARISDLVGSVVVITGRAAATAVGLGRLDSTPGLERLVVLGHYGSERWEAATGEVQTVDAPPGLEQARAELASLVLEADVPVGVEVEDKGIALGVHVRRTADPASTMAILRPPLEALAARTGLVIEPGRMVLELRAPGMDKGAALTRFVTERSARCVVYAGDDLGDLAAFDAVDRLRAEGLAGLTVCSSSAEASEVERRADIVVDGPAGVVELLVLLADLIRTD